MKNFHKELLSISKSVSELAVKLETLAKNINGERLKENPAESPSSSKTIAKETT
jgi:hypothetical protein